MMSLYTECFAKPARSFAKDLMGKFSSVVSLLTLMVGCAILPSCGSSSPTKVAPAVVPTSVSITPSPTVSLELGHTQAFTVTPTGDPFTYQSSNPSVLTVARNGLACAGTWNSLSAPQVCTPGPPGTALVTATTLGVSSPPVTVYVHAPITNIVLSKVAGQPPTLTNRCLSKGAVNGPESWLFQANAYNGTADITASVGPFSWQQISPGSSDIVALSAPANGTEGCVLGQGQCLNEQIVTASIPGVTQIYAAAGGFSSQPISVETCRAQSISVAAVGNLPTTTSFLVSSGTNTTLNATVADTAGQVVTNVPLTWSSSNPASVGISGAASGGIYGSIGTASSPTAGAGTVIASCTPPTCNAGIQPSLPIYPQAALSFNVETGASTATTTAPTVYASTTACSNPLANPAGAACIATVVPVTQASATSAFTAGTPTALPAQPNSFLIDDNPSSAKGYLGVDSGLSGTQGVMVFSGSSVTQATSAPGKVLAISPDQSTVLTSDTFDSPNQVFICNSCSGSSPAVTPLLIKGATAATFSPDSFKAYILAGDTLYVYSKADPLEAIPLRGSASDVVFHPEGGFAYLAGPSASITAYRVCDNSPIPSADLSTSGPPLMIRALPDGVTLLALEPPNIDIINLTSLSATLCTGTVSDTISAFDLGQGAFIPTQFLISPSGSTAYILAATSAGPPPSRLPFIIQFNINQQSTSLISLVNNATPLSAALAPAGNQLFVGADDGMVHVIETGSGLDTAQVEFTFPGNELCLGPGTPATQVPLSEVKILAAAQNGSSTTYSYSLVSGPPLKVGESITVNGASVGGDNGTFTIAALGTDASGNLTFTVSNPLGVTASGQSGTGIVPIPCTPDLLVAKP
jgi:hypothetical protein